MRHGIMTRLQRIDHKILAPEGGAKNYTLPGGCTHEMLGWERKIENSENNMKTTLCAKLPKITLQPEFFFKCRVCGPVCL